MPPSPEPEPLRIARAARNDARADYETARGFFRQAEERLHQAQLRYETLLDEYAGQMELPLSDA